MGRNPRVLGASKSETLVSPHTSHQRDTDRDQNQISDPDRIGRHRSVFRLVQPENKKRVVDNERRGVNVSYAVVGRVGTEWIIVSIV